MSLLPSFTQITIRSQTAAEATAAGALREWGVDFDSGQLTGQLVSGREAVKVWIWKCLMTERFRYPVYSWMYGSELDTYIGRVLTQEYINTDIRLALRDALLINPQISELVDFSGSIEKDVLHISFIVRTTYGEVSILDYEVKEHITAADYAANTARNAILGRTAALWIDDNGHLMLRSYSTVERAVTFSLDGLGHLVTSESPEFNERMQLQINDRGMLEAEYDV